MKVIFLDFDGVLNSSEFLRTEPGPLDRLDPSAVARLNTIVQRSGAKVVVSSSWRLHRPLDELSRLLLSVGFAGEVAGSTPDLSSSTRVADGCAVRSLEIRTWLDQSADSVEQFVVLDDAELDDLALHLVKTSFAGGLLDEHVDAALHLLSAMFPATRDDARSLLVTLGAPPHLLRHIELVGEAADLLILLFREHGIAVDDNFIRAGVVLHDAGKIEHPRELVERGNEHEPAGERMLLAASVTPALARVCLSHARWREMAPTLEELIIALADKLWKGARVSALEERVLHEAAVRSGRDRWDLFIPFDSCFERIAEQGHSRLERSRALR